MTKKIFSFLILTFIVFLTACSTSSPFADIDTNTGCKVGVFGDVHKFVVLTRNGDEFHYAFDDGQTGIVGDKVIIGCQPNSVKTAKHSTLQARSIKITNTQFVVDSVKLTGQLIEPNDADSNTTLIVYAHGSEEMGWIERVRDPYQMVARGISVFVFDKRGTGLSEGNYTQNFPQLSRDLVGASLEAKRLAKARFGRFGLFGLSQGGWIVPLAAKKSGADFIGVGYGLVVDILEEDASQVELELREAGYGDDVVAIAKQITDATALIATSGYTKGLDELDALRREHGSKHWFTLIKGGFSGVIIGKSSNELRENGIPIYDRLDIDWSLDPLEVIRDVEVPQLWVLAGEDREAPIEKTKDRLKLLRSEGKSIKIHVFPNTDHGMWEFEHQTDGSRQYTRITEGFYDLMADWANGRTDQSYGKSVSE